MKVKIIATGDIVELEDGYAARLIEQEIAVFVSGDTPVPPKPPITPDQLVELMTDALERIEALEDWSADESGNIRTAIDAALAAAETVDDRIAGALDTVAIRGTGSGASLTLTYAGGKPVTMKLTIPATQADTVITQPTISAAVVTFNSTDKSYTLPVENNAGVLDLVGKKFTPYRLWNVTADDVTQVGTASGGLAYARITSPHEESGLWSTVMCSHYTPNTATASGNIRKPSVGKDFFIYDEDFTDLETAKTLIGAMGLQVLYAPSGADMPVTMDDVNLTGITSISTDDGSIVLTYNMNTKDYIDAAIAAALA